jgi:sec-independent protein translocase protein TatC
MRRLATEAGRILRFRRKRGGPDLSETGANNTASREEQMMTLFEHIGEFRRRLIYILIVLVIGMIIGLLLADPAYNYLMNQEPVKGMPLHAFSLWDGIGMYMKFALVIALIITLPFAAFQLWAFVKPALREREQRAALTFVPFVLIMFLVGLAFSYFVVFPMAFNFTTKIANHLNLEETYGIVQYFSFLFSILIPISLLFELPILIMFLTKIRIVTPMRLRKMRRLAYFILIFVGVLVTPPDFISDLLVAVPLILLYEISVFLSGVVYRKQVEADKAWEEQYGT